MDDFKQLTEQLLKFYIDTESVDDIGFENFFDDNSSIIGTGKHEFFRNLHEFQESYKFDVKQRGKIRLKIRDLQQEEAELGDDQVLAYGSVVFTGLFENGSVCFEMDTRFSIIYKKVNGKWLVKHLHQSVPDRDQMTGEEFPVTLGKQVEEAHRAISALGTAYYHISRLDLKTKKIELVKRSRKMELGISKKSADWDSQFEVIKDVIAEPFVQKYIDFFDTQTMAARLRNKESMSFEFKKKDGKWFLAMIVPQNYDKDGNITSVLLANRDVTDEKLRELRQEEELREAGRYIDNIQVCGEKLLSLLSNVLDLARIENNKVEMQYAVSDVREDFTNCVTMFQQQAESKNQTLCMTEQILYPYVYVDEPHLSEVCINIISNAVKYTNAGGTISCKVAQRPCEKEDWCDMIISITDNGIGMAEEFQKHIFEAFERERTSTITHIEGSGIGMGIVKKLVDLMGGTIEVESKLGEGSTFTVTIPCKKASKEEALEKKNQNPRSKKSLKGVRVLLVEDNEINAEIATELLKEEGCIVEVATDGVACISMIEKADADYYKMILMDIQMPVMNGFDTTLTIRKMKDDKKAMIPIIAMTANAFAEDRQKALSVGMNDHVAKPVDMNILAPTMMKYL